MKQRWRSLLGYIHSNIAGRASFVVSRLPRATLTRARPCTFCCLFPWGRGERNVWKMTELSVYNTPECIVFILDAASVICTSDVSNVGGTGSNFEFDEE